MDKKEMSCSELDKIDNQRSMKIFKADVMLQKARFSLGLNEQRLVLFAISKIKPTDTAFTEYEFDLKDFYNVCGINGNDSYTQIKKQLLALKSKSWWLTVYDEQGRAWESAVSWFNTLYISENSGKIRLEFHKDMMPYLLELSKHFEENNSYYTSYEFRYVLPMKSVYSIRLYEILKSYQKNNFEWFFNIDKLKHLLDCENYSRYPDFRRRVLEPAVNEINKFTDISIEYFFKKTGNKVSKIYFNLLEKKTSERIEAQQIGLTELDGNIHYWDKNKK